ncbi:MAG TPA: OmpH family outer membrane protein [Terracidiphilus sp.]|nr:OmpH family outer membrane protein [Terracidiphilus sp.]
MKRSIVVPVLVVTGLSLAAAAQTSAPRAAAASAPAGASTPAAPAGPTKIAVIAFQVAVGQTNEFQRALAELQKKYEPKRQQVQALNTEIDNLTKQLQAQGSTLSDADRSTRARIIDEKKKQLDRSAQDAQNDFQQEFQDLYNGTASKVYDVLNGYAEQHGYTLVLDVAGQQTPIMYVVPSTDITKIIVDAYNVKSGVPAPPPQTAAPAPGSVGTPAPKPAAPRATKPPTK